MLERAVYNNLKLLADPKSSFTSFFFAQKDKLGLPVYQRFSQFFSDMDFIVNSILRYFQKNNIAEVEKEVFFSKMEKVIEVYNRKSAKGFDTYRTDLFEQISGRKLQDILDEVAEEERKRVAKEKAEAEARKKAEFEAKQLAAEEARKKEEEARQKAEEERKRQEEEARKKEAEEKRKAEEAAKKISFFDTISTSGDSFFDLDEEDTDQDLLDEDQVEEDTQEDPQIEEHLILKKRL